MREHKADIVFLGAIGALLIFGLLMLFSASSPMGYNTFGDPYFFIKHQILLGLLPGLLGFYILSRIDFNKLRLIAKPFFLLAILLLILVLVPGIGGNFGTARSWIVFAGQSFQPAELTKLALIIFLAHWLSELNKEDFLNWRKSFLPFLAILAILGLLIMKQPDLGTFLVIFMIAVAMYIAAGGEWSHIVILFAGALVGVIGLVFFSPYRFHRLVSFLNPEEDTLGISYHINQALLAVGSGGFWGMGWGYSAQKFQFLPQVNADSIFAVIAEELGFLISSLFIGLLVMIFWCGSKIAQKSSNRFGRLVTIGVMVWLVGQAFFNIATMVGIFPLTGVPLPLVSHGGTALMVMLLALGIVFNISKTTSE